MTLRSRLTLMLLLTLLPLGIVVAGGLYAFVRHSMMARLDDALSARADALASAIRSDEGTLEFDFDNAAMPQYEPVAPNDPARPAYFEVFRVNNGVIGPLVQRSRSLAGATLLSEVAAPAHETAWNADLPGDLDVRVLARRIVPGTEHEDSPQPPPNSASEYRHSAPDANSPPKPNAVEVLVVVAVSRDPVDGPLEILVGGLALSGLILFGASWLSLRWAIDRGLSPLDQLAAQVAAIDAKSLGARLHVALLPREIAPIQDRVNALIARIDAALQREKRFTSGAAHELRTPVAELRTLLEVAESRPRSLDEASRTISIALRSATRLDRLVAALLRLTRIEAGREPGTLAPVRIAEVLDEALADVRPTGVKRNVSFTVSVSSTASALTDRDLFKLAISNVIANAAEYADEGSPVDIVAYDIPSGLAIRVTNLASARAESDAGPLGEPFWRADQARTDSGHLGLGLTLAKAALGAAGASITVSLSHAASPKVIVEIQLRTS